MTKKIVLIVVGAVVLLCGLGAVIPGAFLTAVTGGDNAITTGYHQLSSPTPALVSPTETISSDTKVPTSGFGATKLTVSARDANQPLFLGVARADDLEAYLDGIAHDEIKDINERPFRVDVQRQDGFPFAEPPEDESFWIASATGTDPKLEWNVTEGDYRVVMMNADGTPGPSAEARFGVQVEGLRGLGIGIIVAGALATLLGLGLLLWGILTPSRPRVGPPAPAGPSPYGPSSGPPSSGPPSSGPPPSAPPPSGPPPHSQP
jgi:hypothetical protein